MAVGTIESIDQAINTSQMDAKSGKRKWTNDDSRQIIINGEHELDIRKIIIEGEADYMARSDDNTPGSYATTIEGTDSIMFAEKKFDDITIKCADGVDLFFNRYILHEAGGVFRSALTLDSKCTVLPVDGAYIVVNSYLNWAYRARSARAKWLQTRTVPALIDLGRFAFEYAPFTHKECLQELSKKVWTETNEVCLTFAEASERKRLDEEVAEFLVATKCELEPFVKRWLLTADRAQAVMPRMPQLFWGTVIGLGSGAASVTALLSSVIYQDVILPEGYVEEICDRILALRERALAENRRVQRGAQHMHTTEHLPKYNRIIDMVVAFTNSKDTSDVSANAKANMQRLIYALCLRSISL
jgi:hypothetical protein